MLGRKIVEREQRRVKFHLVNRYGPRTEQATFDGIYPSAISIGKGRCLTSICDTPERAGT